MGAPHYHYEVSFAFFGIDDIAFAIGAGSLISGAASIFGSSSANKANADAQAAANETNLQIARENNAFNKQERLETQQFNRDMWYEQQAYNSPVQQAARLRAAGLNPGLVMDDSGNVGSVVSSTPASASSPIPMQAPHYENTYSSLPSTMSGLSSAMVQAEQAKGLAIDNQTKLADNLSRIENNIADTQSKLASKKLTDRQRKNLEDYLQTQKVQREYLEFQYDREFRHSAYDDETWSKQLRALDDEHEFKTAQTEAVSIANKLQSQFGVKMNNMQLAKMAVEIRQAEAQIGLLAESKHLTQSQIFHEYQKASETIARTVGIKQNNKLFEKTSRTIASEMQLRYKRTESTLRARTNRGFRTLDDFNENFGFGTLRGIKF